MNGKRSIKNNETNDSRRRKAKAIRTLRKGKKADVRG